MTSPRDPPSPTSSAPGVDDDGWRIDDLAQRAGVTVDTIRYYQRQALLPPGERVGRALRYGPDHLERLERIRGLQARRFSLAAIRALLAHEGPIDSLITREGADYDRERLVEAAGTTEAFVDELTRSRFLRTPVDPDAAYDGEDIEVLRAFRDLAELGVPDDVLVAISVVVNERTEALHRAIVGLFAGTAGPRWDPAAKERFERERFEEPARLVRNLRQVLAYAGYRSGQRVLLAELQRDELPPASPSPA